MRKKLELAVLLALVAGLVLLNKNLEERIASERVNAGKDSVVIDPGHGGIDPGKVGIGDTVEKDINLSIAKEVKRLLEKENVRVVMTREEDAMLGGDGSGSSKSKDMKERVKRINDTKADLAVSIHQNSYPDASVHGAQVFYYEGSGEGERAAAIMQQALLRADADNTREAKANSTYYLLRRTEIPTIIIECGFLTNPEEAESLSSEAYQKKMAQAICEGVIECLRQQSVKAGKDRPEEI